MIQTLYTFEELCQHLKEVKELCVAKGRAKGIPCRKWPDLKANTKMRLKRLQVNNIEYIEMCLAFMWVIAFRIELKCLLLAFISNWK